MLGLSRTLSSTHVGHDTVGAEIVTTVHDIYPSVGITRAVRARKFDDLPFLLPDFNDLFLLIFLANNQAFELFQIERAEHDIDKGKLFSQNFRLPLFLRHTSTHGDEQVRLLLFEFFQRADISKRMVFGILANATGIEHDDVYRNPTGINMKLKNIEYLVTDGHSGLSSYSLVDKKALELYNKLPETFELIIKEFKQKYK